MARPAPDQLRAVRYLGRVEAIVAIAVEARQLGPAPDAHAARGIAGQCGNAFDVRVIGPLHLAGRRIERDEVEPVTRPDAGTDVDSVALDGRSTRGRCGPSRG